MFKKNFSPLKSFRLVLRPLQTKDLPAIFSYRNDKQVAQYQSWTEVTQFELSSLIEEQATLSLGKPGEWVMFGIALKLTDELIGDCALCINTEDPRQLELGITLARQAQGKGYAKEAIDAIVTYIFKHSTIERVVMITNLANERCLKLLKNLQLKQTEDAMGFKGARADRNLYGLKTDETLYAITHEEWLLREYLSS